MALGAPSLFAWALLVVVQGQEMVQSDTCKDQRSSNEDDAAMLQVHAQSLLSTDGEWKLSRAGGRCDDVCGKDLCDTSKQEQLTDTQIRDLTQKLGFDCQGSIEPSADDGAPGVFTTFRRCYRYSGQAGKTTCGATFFLTKRFCYCKDPSGGGSGDPHIQSLRGAHYSLLKEGTFLAWSFSKVPVEWQLYAHYAGSTFTTQGLLLLDKSLGRRMEMTAEDCQWRSHHGEKWHAVSGGQELPWKVQTTNLTTPDLVVMGSEISFSMEGPQGQRKVARLLSHCTPHDHLDFKLTMYEKEDIDYVDGELGVDPQVWNKSSLFYSKSSQMQMRNDFEFEASETWANLGGSEAAAEFLRKKQQEQAGASLVLRKDCATESEIRAATKICAKYLKKSLNEDVFADCVFDVCHGGGEAEAERAALLISG